jgi:hypothetical protein
MDSAAALIASARMAVTSVVAGLAALGFLGRVYFVLGLAVYTALCGPTTPVELAWGFMDKSSLAMSTVTCVLGKTLGNMLALFVGRLLLKPLISDLLVRSIGSAVYQHIISELKSRPLQTMSILRAAPLPTPFKIYGLSILPTELVPAWVYFWIAIVFNLCWSTVWCLAGSSVQDATDLAGASKAGLVGKVVSLVGIFGMCVQFARFARVQLQVPTSTAGSKDEQPPPAREGGGLGGSVAARSRKAHGAKAAGERAASRPSSSPKPSKAGAVKAGAVKARAAKAKAARASSDDEEEEEAVLPATATSGGRRMAPRTAASPARSGRSPNPRSASKSSAGGGSRRPASLSSASRR